MKNIWICNVVWGEAYVSSFLEACLPSHLWPENLPYVAKRARVVYRIYTTEKDAEQIKSSSAYRELISHMEVEFEYISKHTNVDIFGGGTKYAAR